MQDTTQNKLLLFQVGPVKCSLYSNDIQTIIPPPKQETAGKNGRLPGMFRHSGHLIRVVDVRAKFGLSPSDPLQGRVIIAELPQGLFAFWVDKVLNVIDQEDGRWDILPAALPRDVFTRTFIMDQELILHTECARLLTMTPSAGLALHIEQLQAKAEQPKVQAPQTSAPPPSSARVLAVSPQQEPAQTSPTAPVTDKPSVLPSKTPTPGAATVRPPAPRPTAPSPTLHATTTPKRTTVAPVQKAVSTKQSVAKAAAPGGRTPALTPPLTGTRPVRSGSSQVAPPVSMPASTSVSSSYHPATPRPGLTRTEPPQQSYSAPKLQRERQPDEDGGMFWPLALMLLLFVIGGGAVVYFSGILDSQTTRSVPRYQAPVVATPAPSIREPEPLPPITDTVEEPEPAVSYSAEIRKQDRVLTITLEGAKDETLLHPQETIENDAMDTSITTENPDSSSVVLSTPSTLTDAEVEPVSEPKPSEPETPAVRPTERPVTSQEKNTQMPTKTKVRSSVTHMVVKGDTLWDIAERYVKDPFRYPELARLSGIKNPDLIYPGDIVQIIVK